MCSTFVRFGILKEQTVGLVVVDLNGELDGVARVEGVGVDVCFAVISDTLSIRGIHADKIELLVVSVVRSPMMDFRPGVDTACGVHIETVIAGDKGEGAVDMGDNIPFFPQEGGRTGALQSDHGTCGDICCRSHKTVIQRGADGIVAILRGDEREFLVVLSFLVVI